MNRKRGRPADDRHLRMHLILQALATCGARGVSAARLHQLCVDNSKAKNNYVKRDIRDLRKAGYDIQSIQRPDGQHVYVLKIVDVRLRKYFSPAERSQLLRAAQQAHLGQLYEDLGHADGDGTAASIDSIYGDVQHAIANRCRLEFTYTQKARTVDPYTLTRKNKGWLLQALEISSGEVKNFYLNKMQNVQLQEPDSAGPVPDDIGAPNLDPMKWRIHDPITVTITTTADELASVVTQVGGRSTGEIGGEVTIEVEVTNIDAFLSRLFDLDSRARLLGPPEIRDAARERLMAVLEATR